MYTDRIDLSIPQADIENVLAAFASAATTIEQLPSVSTSDRKHYAKLGLKNEGLARRIIEVGRSNQELIPRGIAFEQIDRDLVAREQLYSLKLVLERLLGRVDDALLLTGVDLYAAALSMYHSLKRHADKAGLKEVVEDLKKGFARPSRKKKQEEQPAAAAVVPVHSVPEPVAQVPEPQLVAPERVPARTVPAVPPSGPAASLHEQRAQHQSVAPGTSQAEAVPATHISMPGVPRLGISRFTPSALVYEHREVTRRQSEGFPADTPRSACVV